MMIKNQGEVSTEVPWLMNWSISLRATLSAATKVTVAMASPA